MKSALFPTLALTLGFALACSGGSTTAEAPPPPPPPSGAAAGGSVGVPACDDYIKKMEACLGSMDPTMKAQYEAAFKSTRDAWTQAAATPQGKQGLEVGCKAAVSSIPPSCSGGAAPAGAAAGGAPGTPAGIAPGGTAPAGAPPAAGTAPAAGAATSPAATTPAATTTTTTSDTTLNIGSDRSPSNSNAKSPSRDEVRKQQR